MSKRQRRPYGQQQHVQRQMEADSARAAKGSYMESWTDAEIQRCRRGEAEYLHPPDGCRGQAPQSGPQSGPQPSKGLLAGFLDLFDVG